jgi:GT2 family glycosyltransferase
MPSLPIVGVLKVLWTSAMRYGWRLPWRVIEIIANEGWRALLHKLGGFVTARSYPIWIKRYDTLTDAKRQNIRDEIARWPVKPFISVLMPVFDTDVRWLRAAVRSLEAQLYPHWELCISDDASTNPEVRDELTRAAQHNPRIRLSFCDRRRGIAGNTNVALALASGEFVALLDADDLLSETALYWVANEIAQHPDSDLIFSDEDKIDERGYRYAPNFKPDWNPALMLSQNSFSHLGVYRRSLVERVGSFRQQFEGAQDHDLALRCSRATEPRRIHHIPRILYHWRATSSSTASDIAAKPHALEAGRRAVQDFLARTAAKATAATTRFGIQVDYPVPAPRPLVSILVPTTAKPDLLHPCAGSILERSTYDNFEFLLLVNETHRAIPERAALLDQLAAQPRVRALTYPDRPFNYSWVNNWAAAQARGSLLCLLNDDTEVITPDWLEKLVARVTLDKVAAAGPMMYRRNETIQHAGVILGLGGVAAHAFTHEPRGSPGYFCRAGLEQDLSCVTAGCMLLRRDVFQAVGGFDERFAVAFNDVDLCLRIRAAGWRILWTPAVELYHDESVSVGQVDSPERIRQFAGEIALMRQLWGPALDADPFYNPNLSLLYPFALASPPRHKD